MEGKSLWLFVFCGPGAGETITTSKISMPKAKNRLASRRGGCILRISGAPSASWLANRTDWTDTVFQADQPEQFQLVRGRS